MNNVRRYTPQDSLVELINDNYSILPVLSRFSIPLGFENRRIADVCTDAGIDSEVFLFIVNFILSGKIDNSRMSTISPEAIVDFLHNSHDYYLSYKIPHIRQNLLNALDESHSDINPAIIRFFDDYIEQVKEHFRYEEKKVFPYVRNLMSGKPSRYNIGMFKKHHDDIDEKLSDLKNIILRYYTTSMPNKMYDVLVDIYNCEEDLKQHTDIENHILIPMISLVEQRNRPNSRI
ncbi:MAG: hemerythrin domain-containing protein [Muribaculaceae bacterium]